MCSEEESTEGSGEESGVIAVPMTCMATRTRTGAVEGPNGEDYLTHNHF